MNELELLRQQLTRKTVTLADQIINATNHYVDGFDKKDFFSFSRNQSQSKEEYNKKYCLFLIEISPIISELTSVNARLASLLINADKAMDVELVVLCEKSFNAFEAFEHDMHEYTEAMESLLEASSPSASSIINLTQKFKNAIELLIKANI